MFRYVHRLLGNKRPRAPPSGADPATLLPPGTVVETEEDVLHLTALPDFDGRLGARDCTLAEPSWATHGLPEKASGSL